MKRVGAFILFLLVGAARAAIADCTGWAGFKAPARYASLGNQVVLVTDLDGDGAPEIITSGNQVEELATFSLLPNRGDGTFGSEQLLPAGFGQTLQDAGDLNGDGIPDLVASNYFGNGIAIYHGLGALRFDAGISAGTATHGGPTRIVDYDRDGVPDLVSFSFGSGNPVRVHLFRGGALESKMTFETPFANAASPSIRTINGAIEILAGERSGHLEIYRVPGLTISTRDAGPGFDLNSMFADVNGDGVADIIDTNDAIIAGESIFISLGKPDGTFGDRKQIDRPRHVAFPVAMHAGDFDGDGHIDLVVSDFRTPTLYFFRGDGAGGFAEGVAIDAGAAVNDFEVADVNGDGRPDLVTVNEDHSVSVILNSAPCHGSRRRAVLANDATRGQESAGAEARPVQ